MFTGRYEEIIEPERIVYTANMDPAVIHVTVEFSTKASVRRWSSRKKASQIRSSDKLCPKA